MQRYQEFSEIISNYDGKRRYGTLYYPEFERKDSDIYIITNITHRLDNLAYQYYGDPRFWVILARANKLHSATFRPPIGFRLRIPYPLNYDEIKVQFDLENEND